MVKTGFQYRTHHFMEDTLFLPYPFLCDEGFYTVMRFHKASLFLGFIVLTFCLCRQWWSIFVRFQSAPRDGGNLQAAVRPVPKLAQEDTKRTNNLTNQTKEVDTSPLVLFGGCHEREFVRQRFSSPRTPNYPASTLRSYSCSLGLASPHSDASFPSVFLNRH